MVVERIKGGDGVYVICFCVVSNRGREAINVQGLGHYYVLSSKAEVESPEGTISVMQSVLRSPACRLLFLGALIFGILVLDGRLRATTSQLLFADRILEIRLIATVTKNASDADVIDW